MYQLETKYKAIVHYSHFLKSLRKVSNIYNVSKSTLQRWLCSNGIQPRKTKSRKQLSIEIRNFIGTVLSQNPFCRMKDLSDQLFHKFNLKRSARTTCRYTKASGWTRKKAFRNVDFTHSPEALLKFSDEYTHAHFEKNIICIDECSFYVGDHDRYGYAKKGQRLRVMGSKTLRRTKFTVIMAVTRDGVLDFKIQEENCKKNDFIKFIKNIPEIHNGVVVMDNIPFHHSQETKAVIFQRGLEVIYTPSYSPKFNAIEYVFSTIKRQYRMECSACGSNDVDHVGLFDWVIQTQGTLDKTFNHVLKSIQAIKRNNGVNIIGYD